MATSNQQTFNYLVPASGTTHAVFQQCDFTTAGSTYEDWRSFSTNHFTFRPQGVFIDNTSGTQTAIFGVQGTPFVARMPAGFAGWVSFPSTANLITNLSGSGTVNLTYVDFPVFNSVPVDANGNTSPVGNVSVESSVTDPVYTSPIVAGSPIATGNPLPTRSIINSTLTDASGSITTAATSQQVFASASSRSYIYFQNLSSADLYLDFTSDATSGSGSILVPAGGVYSQTGNFVSTEALNAYGATAGQAFTCKYA